VLAKLVSSVAEQTIHTVLMYREWPYLSCTELVAKRFYLLLCAIIIFVCILMFVKEMVIK